MSLAGTAASAMQWLGRGQSYRALGQEIAWATVRAAGGGRHDLQWLSPLVQTKLEEHLDQLPRVSRRAALRAEAEHLRTRPHDREGADLLAELAAHDAAIEHLSTAYMDVLDWAVRLIRARQAEERRRLGGRRRLFGKRSEIDSPVHCEVPQRVLDGLTRHAEQPGWPHRRAA